MNPLLMVWNLEEVAVKPFAHFYNEMLMILQASGGCVNPVLMLRNLREDAVKHYTMKYLCFWKLQEAAVNP